MGIKTLKRKAPIKKGAKKTSTFKRKLIVWSLELLLLGILLLLLFYCSVYFGLFGPIPTVNQLHQIKNPNASEVYSADGKVLGRYYIQNRSNVKYNDISPNVINALVATEDARFYQHRGIDEVALMRVLFKTLLLGDKSAGGGSTLSQQIAKNLYPRKSYGMFSMPINKLSEAIVAYRLEKIYSKEEVLTLYLNSVPFADNTYGIEVASERFFSKKPKFLKIEEAAVLVGMLKANTTYNPRKYPKRSLERRNIVIDQMVKYGSLSFAEGEDAKAKPLLINYKVISFNQGPAPYVLENLRPQLEEWCDSHQKPDGTPYSLYADGLKIHTTINSSMQEYAVASMAKHMTKLQSVFDEHWKNREPWGDDNAFIWHTAKRQPFYAQLKNEGLTEKEIKNKLEVKHDVDLFKWGGDEERVCSTIDSLKHFIKILQTGFLALDPYTGEVKSYIGGVDFRYFKYDHVWAKRQVGSTFKPFVYLSALEQGVKPDAYFPNELKTYTDYDDWTPRNSHEEYTGYYSMKGALAKSINTIAVEVLLKAGIENTIDVARRLGIDSDLPSYPSLALGVASISLKEMVCAYAAIVNGGRKVEPYLLVDISDENGTPLEKFANRQSGDAVVNEENTKIVMQMLKAVVDEGTGRTMRTVYNINGDIAGKTGTTQNHADGWFMGVSPRLVAGAWVGADDPSIHFRTITYGQGAYMALPIVGGFYKSVYSDKRFNTLRYATFSLPDSTVLTKLSKPIFKEHDGIEGVIDNLGKWIFKKDSSAVEAITRVRDESEKKEKGKVWEAIKSIFKKSK